ncbi:MAG: hypothetical protein Q8Q33_05105 [Chlamydiota bacterium]|nr:hypothetical protein [Chlamydiota bacterium]
MVQRIISLKCLRVVFIVGFSVAFLSIQSAIGNGHERSIALKSKHNGYYVRAGVGSRTQLAAISKHVRGWEKFTLLNLSDGSIALRSVQNAKYIGIGTNGLLEARSSRISEREKFVMINVGQNEYALKSKYNNLIVRAGIGNNTLLGAVSKHIKAWEKFEIIFLVPVSGSTDKNEMVEDIMDSKNDAVDATLRMMRQNQRTQERIGSAH